MRHLTVAGLATDKDPVLDALMRLGAVAMEDAPAPSWEDVRSHVPADARDHVPADVRSHVPSDTHEEVERRDAPDLGARIADLESVLQRLARLVEASRRHSGEKKPLFTVRRLVRPADLEAVAADEPLWLSRLDAFEQAEARLLALRGQQSRLAMLADVLEPWLSLSFDPALEATESTILLIGTLPSGPRFEAFLAQLAEDVPEHHLDLVSQDPSRVRVVLAVHASREESARSLLKAYGFHPLPALPGEGMPTRRLDTLREDQARLEAAMAAVREELAGLSRERAAFELLHDHLQIRLERLRAEARLLSTDRTFVLAGWVPAHLADRVDEGLRSRFVVAVGIREPEAGEEPPILLRNRRLVRPYEVITEMFSPPSTGDADPNPVMAPFYFLMFGMMLSDVGYGLLLCLLCGLLVWKVRVEGTMRKMCLLLFQGGLSSIAWGILFGSWFGDIASVVSSGRFVIPPLLFNPMLDPVRLMILSVLLGAIHLLVGLGTKAYLLVLAGKPWDALFDVVSWMLVLLGLGLLAVGGVIATVGMVMAAAGAGLIVLFGGRSARNPVARIGKGLYALYGITSYLGDILSYTRILALGLATAVIAMVVNLLGAIAGFGPIGIVLFLLVGVFGHALNLALSALGAYVHTSRLQYVEFFSKFYEGGGQPFRPLQIRTRYTVIAKAPG